MFPKISFTSVITVVFLAYMANALWSIASLYLPPSCEKDCLQNGLHHIKDFKAGLRFLVLTTEKMKPSSEKDMSFVTSFDITNLEENHEEELKMKLSSKVLTKNATQFLALFTLPIDPKAGLDKAKIKWNQWIRSEKAIFTIIPLTKIHVPEAETFQLLGKQLTKTPLLIMQQFLTNSRKRRGQKGK